VKSFSASELILNRDGSIYHLGLFPEDISQIIITVGDPDRVQNVSQHFDSIELQKQCREFVTHTGIYKTKRISVISTGIGTDNVDIALMELDALINIDLNKRQVKEDHTSLDIIRLGTTGSIVPGQPVDEIILAERAIDASGWWPWYQHVFDSNDKEWMQAMETAFPNIPMACFGADKRLLEMFRSSFNIGVCYTAAGFYAPQGRVTRLDIEHPHLIEKLAQIRVRGERITNIEMETSGLYGLGKLLGHRMLSVSAVLANRADETFSSNAAKTVDDMIVHSLELIAEKC
jgi:uridine phosphorylase